MKRKRRYFRCDFTEAICTIISTNYSFKREYWYRSLYSWYQICQYQSYTMKTIICLVLLCNSFIASFAQNFHVTLSAGATNYSGDLQVKRYTFNQAQPAAAIGISYEVSENIFIRSQFTAGKITANDKFNPLTAVRNLNFTSSLTEVQLAAEYYLRDMYEYALSPYVFAGIAAYHFNPYTKDTAGTKYFLQPLSTEGQGFFQDRKAYKLTQLALPFGGGIKLALSENIRVGIEVGMRKLFTDYLDDVSSTYVDPNILIANRGAKSAELAFRGNELKNSPPLPVGDNRGSAKYKDWYYFSGITTTIRLGSSDRSGARPRSKVDCPTRF